MPVSYRATQFAEQFKKFIADGGDAFQSMAGSFSEFDGPTLQEAKNSIAFLRATFEPLIESGQLVLVGYHSLTQLQAQLQQVYNNLVAFMGSRDQSTFQNFVLTLDSLACNTRSYGVPYLTLGATQIENTRAALQLELDKAVTNNRKVEDLAKQVSELITPAVAGSLSNSFTNRQKALTTGRYVWLAVVVVLGIFAMYETFDLVKEVARMLEPKLPAAAAASATAATATVLPNSSFWAIALLRSLVLLPLFASFGFAFAQYRKERDFEEEYAHKAAVANSLPNYGDLAREGNIRDQIVTAATTVIFSSPSEQARKAESSNMQLGGMKEMIEMMTKAFSKK